MSKKFCVFALVFVLLFTGIASAALAAGRAVWSFKTDAGISGNIAVAGDLILAGDASGKFYAVNKNTGRLAWSQAGKNSIVGTPAVSGSSVVVSYADGTIACLNLNNGSVIWLKEAAIEGVGLTVVDGAAIGDGKVYIARGDGVLYALNLTNGQTVWTYKTDSYELRTAPSFAENYVLLGEQNGKFDMIDPKTGKRVTGGGAGGAVNTPVVSNGDVYFSSWDGSVQRVQIKGVIPKWNSKVGDPITTKPVIAGSRVFVGTANGFIFALSAEGGNILWRYETNGGSIEVTPVFADSALYIVTGQGSLLALDAATGRERVDFGEYSRASTSAYENGTLFIAGGASINALR